MTLHGTTAISVHVGGLIVGIVLLMFGIGAIYAAVALIRNLHGFADKALKNYADYPGRGGWRRASADDPSRGPSEGTTLLAFHYVPKTMRQVRLLGWATLPVGLFITAGGLAFTIGAFTGAVE